MRVTLELFSFSADKGFYEIRLLCFNKFITFKFLKASKYKILYIFNKRFDNKDKLMKEYYWRGRLKISKRI